MNGSVYESGTLENPTRNCFAILVDNEPGVLARVIGLFSGRGYNIESLTVDEVDREARLSRITIITSGPPMVIDQIKVQLRRIVPVRRVVNLTQQGRHLEGCMAFVKVVAAGEAQDKAAQVAKEFGARVADATHHAVIYELTGSAQHINRFIDALQPFGVTEIARTGATAMACGEAAMSVPPAALLRAQG